MFGEKWILLAHVKLKLSVFCLLNLFILQRWICISSSQILNLIIGIIKNYKNSYLSNYYIL